MLTAQSFIEKAKQLIANEEYTKMYEALPAAAESMLTSEDCKAWHNEFGGENLTPNLNAFIDAVAAEFGDTKVPHIWGGVDDEPLSVSLESV